MEGVRREDENRVTFAEAEAEAVAEGGDKVVCTKNEVMEGNVTESEGVKECDGG